MTRITERNGFVTVIEDNGHTTTIAPGQDMSAFEGEDWYAEAYALASAVPQETVEAYRQRMQESL